MGWGVPRRPKISTKLGNPNPREGSDGDTQIRQTNLGAKLFGKIGGRWYSTFLSSEEEIIGTSGTKIGMSSSGALTVDQINLTGKIILTSDATRNVCIGVDNSDAGDDNISIGSGAGESLQSGNDSNVCIGTDAGTTLSGTSGTSPQQNVLIGYEAGKTLNGNLAHYNVAIGYKAILAGSNLSANVAVGTLALGNVSYSGTYNTAMGNQAGASITSGDYNTLLGASATCSATADNQTAIGNGAAPNSADDIAIGNTSVDEIKGQVDFSTFSDERIKTNIIDGDLGLDFIKLLKPRKFNKVNPAEYHSSIKKPQDGDGMIWTDAQANKVWDGLVSQEVKEAIDTCGTTYSGWNEESNSKQLLTYPTMVVPLIKAVQELSAKLDTMQTEINNLKAE